MRFLYALAFREVDLAQISMTREDFPSLLCKVRSYNEEFDCDFVYLLGTILHKQLE